MSAYRFASRVRDLVQSDIRRMSRECDRLGGINLGQGICDQPVPAAVKAAAIAAVEADQSAYTRLDGIDELRRRIARKMRDMNGVACDPDGGVVVTIGSTGAFVAACLALLEPGDEVVVFAPFYGYHVNILTLCGARPRFVDLRPPDWSFEADALRAAFSPRTRLVVVNTPSNPTGKVFRDSELALIGDLCREHDVLALTDEIYEYILYDGNRHISLASLPGMAERTITLSGFSKTYNMTGWRLGYAVGPPPLLEKVGVLSDLLAICAPTPLQHALVAAFDLPPSYYADLSRDYARKREVSLAACRDAGFEPVPPQGSYYFLMDVSRLGARDDREAAALILERAGVATVPGGSFFPRPEDGRHLVRLCFAKRDADLEEACARLRRLAVP